MRITLGATICGFAIVSLVPGRASLAQNGFGSIVGWGSQVVGVDLSADFVALAAGGEHSLCLKADGSIVAWGKNDDGQCDVPAPNADFVALAGSLGHSLGLKSDGSIVAWGDNDRFQCDVPSPNAGFVGIAAGWRQSLGIRGFCACGDLDHDGYVGLNDFNTFATCFSLFEPSPACSTTQFACSDLNSSGSVGLDDFATFALLFATVPTTAVPYCMP